MKVMCNTSPIIGLLSIKRFSLLWELFEEVIIPQAVYEELCVENEEYKQEIQEIKTSVSQGKISVYQVKNSQMVKAMYGKLHYGELEVIVGAKELDLSVAIIDEIAARKMAAEFLIDTIGIMGVLFMAKKRGIMKEIRPDMELLRKNGYRISDKLFEEILRKAGE